MKKDPLFFIALLPPEEIQREVTAFKQYIADAWGPQHALKSPPHITLQPPFTRAEKDLSALKKCLSGFASSQKAFSVELNDFGAFPPRVIFVRPLINKRLEDLPAQLAHCLAEELDFRNPRFRQPFHPHMTIAHRDVEAGDFLKIWSYFREKSFHRAFEADTLALLRNVQGKWEIEANFRFGDAGD